MKRNPDARPPGGESAREHLQRVKAWLREVAPGAGPAPGGGHRSPDTVIAVAHYGTIGLLGMLCGGIALGEYLARRPEYLTPGYGDLIGYRWRGGRWERQFLFRCASAVASRAPTGG